jgi:hypothetical protein
MTDKVVKTETTVRKYGETGEVLSETITTVSIVTPEIDQPTDPRDDQTGMYL